MTVCAGEKHKSQRKMLNPAFSTKHLRDMTSIFHEVTHKVHLPLSHFLAPLDNNLFIKFQSAMYEQVGGGPREINMLAWTTRVALELIGQSGLGKR